MNLPKFARLREQNQENLGCCLLVLAVLTGAGITNGVGQKLQRVMLNG
jgi:hypothetical protein